MRPNCWRASENSSPIVVSWKSKTPIPLGPDVTVDRHLESHVHVVGRRSAQATSRTDPLAANISRVRHEASTSAGATAIYQITRAFRNAEIGPLHNPEFTIVEWYRVGDDMQAGMSLLSDFCQALLGTAPAERLSYADAFERHVHINPHVAAVSELAAAAKQLGIEAPLQLSDSRDDWLNLLLAERVEPNLGQTVPTILYDYPASQAALAKTRPEKLSPATHQTEPVTYSVAERFELYFHGLELANGYHELLDAAELSRRNGARQCRTPERFQAGAAGNKGRLLAAMQAGLPACTGVALGFDRLVMLASGAKKLSEVVAFPYRSSLGGIAYAGKLRMGVAGRWRAIIRPRRVEYELRPLNCVRDYTPPAGVFYVAVFCPQAFNLCPGASRRHFAVVCCPWPVPKNEGQDDLDQATEKKLSAESMDDLAKGRRPLRKRLEKRPRSIQHPVRQ